MNDNRGFTLIELLVVMIILAGISLIAVSGISESLQRREIRDCVHQQELAINAAKLYFSLEDENNSNRVTVGELIATGYFEEECDNQKEGDCWLKDTDLVEIRNDGYYYNGYMVGESCQTTR